MQEKDKNTSNSAWVSRLMNKYTITLLIFLVWLAFFDRNSLVGKMQLRGKIATLKKEKAYYNHRQKIIKLHYDCNHCKKKKS